MKKPSSSKPNDFENERRKRIYRKGKETAVKFKIKSGKDLGKILQNSQ